jgi:peptide deformylase
VAWDWLGEPLAIDFANTVRRRGARYEELLRRPGDLVAWARHERGRVPVPARADAERALLEVRACRDDVFAVLRAAAAGEALPPAAARRIDARARALPVVAQLDHLPGRRRLVAAHRAPAVDELLARACAAAIELVGGDAVADLGLCDAPSCGQFYVRGRRDQVWCGPACGTRARVARHAAAHRTRRGPKAASKLSAMADIQHDAERDVEVAQEERPEPPPLDPEVAARREAALEHVVKYGDPVLRTRAREVEVFDEALRAEIARMAGLMHDSLGIGLAATQLGRLSRVLVYRVEHDSPVNALVNPVLEWAGDAKEWMEEGCLSLPGVHVDVERPVHVRVRARDGSGDELLIEASGLEARVIQHEVDHLDGVLILDRTPRDQRREAMRALRERLEAA